MVTVTEIDRKAAEELRAVLADMSGFWFAPGDTGPLCAALARHRAQTEAHLLEKIHRSAVRLAPTDRLAKAGNDEVPANTYGSRRPNPRPAAIA